VLVLQHPREQDVVLGTAKLLTMSLAGSTLAVGLSWASLAQAWGKSADPARWAVVFPRGAKAAAGKTSKTSKALTAPSGATLQRGSKGAAAKPHPGDKQSSAAAIAEPGKRSKSGSMIEGAAEARALIAARARVGTAARAAAGEAPGASATGPGDPLVAETPTGAEERFVADGFELVDHNGRPVRPRRMQGIVLLDGSWSQAKSLWWRNPWLLKLARLTLHPKEPSIYGSLRPEPRRQYISTLEATGAALSALGEPATTEAQLRRVFRTLVQRFRDTHDTRGKAISAADGASPGLPPSASPGSGRAARLKKRRRTRVRRPARGVGQQ
jgi:DTW domain-containing protein YfiP